MPENRVKQGDDGELDDLYWEDVKIHIERLDKKRYWIRIAGDKIGFILYGKSVGVESGFDYRSAGQARSNAATGGASDVAG